MLSGNAASTVIFAVITIALAKFLEPVELGYLLAGEAFVEMFSFFFNFGFNHSILKKASKEKNFDQGLELALGTALMIRCITCIPVSLLIYLIASFSKLEPQLLMVVETYIIIELLESFTKLFGIIRRALEQFKLIASINVANRFIRLALVFIVFMN